MHFLTDLLHVLKTTSENGIIGRYSHHRVTTCYIEFYMFFNVIEELVQQNE